MDVMVRARRRVVEHHLDPAQHQVLDRIEVDGARAKGILDRRVHIVQDERLEPAQDLHVLAPSGPARTCLPSIGRRSVANASGSSYPASGAAWSSAPSLRSMRGR